MAKKILKAVFILGYVFYGLYGLYSLWNLLLRNEVVALFEFKETDPIETHIGDYERNNVKIAYNYQVSDKVFADTVIIYNKSYEEKLAGDSIKVMYNSSQPSVSYLKNAKLVNEHYIGFYFSLFWIVVILLVDRFADKDKWIRRYQRAFTSNKE